MNWNDSASGTEVSEWLLRQIHEYKNIRQSDVVVVNPVTKDEKDEFQSTIKDLRRTNKERAEDLELALEAKKTAERKLKLIMKVIVRLGIYDELKAEIKKATQEEKDHIKLLQFFGRHTNQLEDFEEQLADLE